MIDEMKIGTGFMKGMVSKILNLTLKRRLGYDIGIRLNDFNVKVTEERAHVHLNIDADMTQEELTKILAAIGLG